MNPEGGKARHGSDYTRLKFDVSNIGAADQLLEVQGHPLVSLRIKENILSKHDLIKQTVAVKRQFLQFVKPKSRIIRIVLLKNDKHDVSFPTFQKKILHIKTCIKKGLSF